MYVHIHLYVRAYIRSSHAAVIQGPLVSHVSVERI